MRTTKNVNVRENQFGFAIYNNGVVVATADNLTDAENKAIAIAKVENKGVKVNTDFYNTYISNAKVQTR